MNTLKQKHSKTEKFLKKAEVEFLDAKLVTEAIEASVFKTVEEAEAFLKKAEVEFLNAKLVTEAIEASVFKTVEEAEVFLYKTTYFYKGYTIINMEEV